MEMVNETEVAVRQIEHRFHEEHPLVFVEDQISNVEGCCCYGCGEVISGPCYSCVQCNYHLHKECAEAPDSIPNHPLHPKHDSGFFLVERPYPGVIVYGCALCKEKRNMFFYQCRFCWFPLDIKCANLSSSYKFNQESKPDLHQHPLTFFENGMAELKKLNCVWCHESLKDSVYFCFECPFILHKKCLDELPTKINHPSHHKHPLFLESNENGLFCKLCQKQHSVLFYSCSLCHDFHIHIECAWPRSIVEDKSCHQHPFNLYLRQEGSFICDACDTEGNYISYICLTCSITVHKDCTSLPRIIKHSRHDHCLFHKYFVETQELTIQDCRLCFKEVKLERGSYSCVKPGCKYVVHVKCALQNEYLYNVIEDENQCEELYENLAKSLQPSITRVVEVNQDGEAIVIEHFSHPHCLMLADKITDRKCDGCMLSISTTLFYYCPECPFFLHKTCAELARNKPHWFRPYDVTLESIDIWRCRLCIRLCSGFFYDIGGWRVCLRCAKVPDVIEECEGHQHLLFFDFKCRERCDACGVDGSYFGAFRCGKCTFTLDFACLTLPQSTHHKFDEHVLRLTYHQDDDDKEECICDICEKERDPNLWYYHCSICDNSAHTKCVLGEFPFVQDGSMLSRHRYIRHRHRHRNLMYFRKAEGYPDCSVCGRLCLEEILKCAESTCDYIIHCKCRHV